MKRLLFIIALMALCACRDTSPVSDREVTPLIGSSTYRAMTTEADGTSSASTLADGTQALFNATGGLTLTDQVMTYTNDGWTTHPQPQWNAAAEETQLTALYPFLDNATYTEGRVYDANGMLTDVLCAQATVAVREDIHLQFNHLFSMITFQLSTRLQQKFQSITLTYPKKVASINPLSASVTLTEATHAVTLSTPTTDGRYSFIVPAAEDVTISLTVETTAKRYAPKEIASCTFVQGHETVYRVDSDEKKPGISTTADFIKFSQLINISYPSDAEKEALKSFGETDDNGITTYYLLNDLDFEEVDCNNLKQIGYYSTLNTTRFEDIFDGQGYTISNITPVSGNQATGLFGAIGSNGIVKNLHIESCEFVVSGDKGSKGGVATLVGYNWGVITNCSVTNSTINSGNQDAPTGGLVGDSRGTIINCYVKNVEVESITSSGAIVGNSYGDIFNCYSFGNTLISKNNGGISGKSVSTKPTLIKNCYVYNLKFEKGYKGLFYGYTNEQSSIEHSFYNTSGTSKFVGDGSATATDVTKINDLEVPLYQKLNEWIDAHQASYPNLSFTKWKQGISPTTAIFLTE